MSSLANLANSLQSMGLSEKKIDYHELQIEYPVLDLLPVDEHVTPFLRPPTYSGFREKPNPEEYHLPLSGTDFTVRLPLTNEPSSHSSLKLDDVFAVLASLPKAQGRSVLQIVTYIDPEDGDMYRFRLLTQHGDQLLVNAESELSSITFEAERVSRRKEVCMRLIWRLLHRLSARAYFHVDERLKRYRWYAKQVAEEDWNWVPAFCAAQFCAANLRVVVACPGVSSYSQALKEGDSDGQGEGTFLLPCGHEQGMLVQRLSSMSILECLELSCRSCGVRVTRHNKDWRVRLQLLLKKERRASFVAREAVWQHIANEWPVEPQQISVDGFVLQNALRYALLSVLPPESGSPMILRMTRSDTLVKAVRALQKQCENGIMVTDASFSIFDGLLEEFDRSAGQAKGVGCELGNLQHLPSGWVALVRLWLTRAAQLAGAPDYAGQDPIVVFGEEAIEEEDVNYDDTELDELELLMRDSRLE